MSELPYMPLWIEPLLADTNHLSHAEFGCYVRLLCAMWRMGGSVPDDEAFLRKLLAGQGDRRNWPPLRQMLEQFVTHEDGRITQKRLQKVRLMQHTKTRNNATAAMKRWHGDDKPLKSHNDGDANAYADAYANAMPRARALKPKPNKNSAPPPAESAILSQPSTVGSTPSEPPEERASVARDLGITPPARSQAPEPTPPRKAPTRMANSWDVEKRFPPGPQPLGETKFLKAWREANGDFTKIPSLPGAPNNKFPALSQKIRQQFGLEPDPNADQPQAHQDDPGILQRPQRAPDPEGPPAHQAGAPDGDAKGPPTDDRTQHPDLGKPDDEPA